MKIEEIAEVLGAPLSTVKTRLRRALERLRVILDANYPGENWQ
jgi:DNA-directed RNA polymerase specialized sigma24 family protein